MREVLVDYARAHNAKKRAGTLTKVDLDNVLVYTPDKARALLDLDDALDRLAQLSPRQSRVVELRYFAGLSSRKLRRFSVWRQHREKRLGSGQAWLQRELKKIP